MEIISREDNSKHRIAYSKIKNAIIKNQFAPGTLLVERQLSEQLGVSRTPIREALRKLVGEGLVEFIPNRGVFVSSIRLEDIIEIYELREALDGMAVCLCTQRMNESVIDGLKQSVKNQADALENKDYNKYIENDMEFHAVYIKGAGNSRLEYFLNAIIDQINRLANTSVGDIERARLSLEQHRKVLDAMLKNEPKSAEALIKEHLINIKEYYISRLIRK